MQIKKIGRPTGRTDTTPRKKRMQGPISNVPDVKVQLNSSSAFDLHQQVLLPAAITKKDTSFPEHDPALASDLENIKSIDEQLYKWELDGVLLDADTVETHKFLVPI